MKMISQTLKELGADEDRAFTVVPSFGAYFKCVLAITEFSSQRVVLKTTFGTLTLLGDGLKVGEYFECDAIIRGNIEEVKIDEID